MSVQRQTRQQRAIFNAVATAGRPLTVHEIHEKARVSVPSLGLRTVFRVIRRLESNGDVSSIRVPGHGSRYEPAGVAATHHHHFHCTACDRVFDIPGCTQDLEQLLPPGFDLEGHEMTLWGSCGACAT